MLEQRSFVPKEYTKIETDSDKEGEIRITSYDYRDLNGNTICTAEAHYQSYVDPHPAITRMRFPKMKDELSPKRQRLHRLLLQSPTEGEPINFLQELGTPSDAVIFIDDRFFGTHNTDSRIIYNPEPSDGGRLATLGHEISHLLQLEDPVYQLIRQNDRPFDGNTSKEEVSINTTIIAGVFGLQPLIPPEELIKLKDLERAYNTTHSRVYSTTSRLSFEEETRERETLARYRRELAQLKHSYEWIKAVRMYPLILLERDANRRALETFVRIREKYGLDLLVDQHMEGVTAKNPHEKLMSSLTTYQGTTPLMRRIYQDAPDRLRPETIRGLIEEMNRKTKQ